MAVSLNLIFASLLASTRKPGWKPLTIILGIAYIYLGIAAISIPDQTGSWGMIGGILSILGGIAYIGCSKYNKSNRT